MIIMSIPWDILIVNHGNHRIIAAGKTEVVNKFVEIS